MVGVLNSLLVVVLLLNLALLGMGRIKGLITAAALQGVVLGLLAVVSEGRISLLTVGIGAATIAVKGSLIPGILRRALRDARIKREVEPLIGLMPSMLLGATGTAAAIALASRLPLAGGNMQTLLVPASLSTVFTGFLLLTGRAKAITQTIGYLILENGIFIFGLMLLEAMPFLVELGVLLDVFVAIFVISIIIHHINAEFTQAKEQVG